VEKNKKNNKGKWEEIVWVLNFQKIFWLNTGLIDNAF